jgi:hypothetical protein
MTIQISNRRIIEFCDKHPSFDLESTVLSFIQFIEETNASTVPTLDSNLAYQIIENLKSLEQKVHGLDSAISMKHTEYLNKYIEDIKNIMTLNNTEKLQPIIKEYNEIFIDKITLLFKDIIPKEQQTQRDYLQSVIKSIEQIMIVEMNKGATKQSIDNIVSIIEQKFENVFSVISVNKQQESILNNKLDDIIDKFSKTSNKGRISENMLKFNLQAVYPTAEIKNVTGIPHSGDFWILRKDKPSILIENKNHDSTIQKEEVQKFIDNMNTQDMCGILISQKTNIVYRNNYEIEIHNGNIAVYIHECNYDPHKIKIAVQIIDIFKEKIKKQKIENGNTLSINMEILHKINKEFQLFNIKKTQHLAEIKNMYETLTKSAEDMEFKALDEFLESHGLLTNVKKFVCGNCPRTFKTQKGLDTHERQCQGELQEKNKGFKCEYCEEIKPTIKGLRTHCAKKHGTSF